jgi:hypothetical protein
MQDISDFDPLFLPHQKVWAEGRPAKIAGHAYVHPGPYQYLVDFDDDRTRKWLVEDEIDVLFLH